MQRQTEAKIRQVSSGMPVEVERNTGEYRHGIEDVRKPLMLLNIPRFAERKLADPVNRPDQDEQTSDINNNQQTLPALEHLPAQAVDRAVLVVWGAGHAVVEVFGEAPGGEVEADGDDAEEAEAGDLDAEAGQDDGFAAVELLFRVGVG